MHTRVISFSFADSPSVTPQCERGGGGGTGVIKEEAGFAIDFFAKRTTFCWEERKVRFFALKKCVSRLMGGGEIKLTFTY